MNEILKNELLSYDQIFFKFLTQDLAEFNAEKEKTTYTKYILNLCNNVKNYIYVKYNSTQKSHASEKIEILFFDFLTKKNSIIKLLDTIQNFSKLFEVKSIFNAFIFPFI